MSVNGSTDGAVKIHSTGTALVVLMDGLDLMAVLEEQIPMDEMLLRKRRRAVETGSPMLRASEMLD